MDLASFFPKGMPRELQDMYTYLQGARQMPSIRPSGGFPEGTLGTTNLSDNTIEYDPSYQSHVPTTIAHEFAHSVHRQQGKQFTDASRRLRNGDSSGPMDAQYVDAYNKLFHLAGKQLPPHRTEDPEDERYRYRDRDEALAFGIANTLLPEGKSWKVAPHIDASAAQEHQIMMDFARRHANQTRTTPSSFLEKLFGK